MSAHDAVDAEEVFLQDLPSAEARLMHLAERGRSRAAACIKAADKKRRLAERKATEKRLELVRQKREAKIEMLKQQRAKAADALRTVRRQQAALRAAQTRADRKRKGLGPKRAYKKPSAGPSGSS